MATRVAAQSGAWSDINTWDDGVTSPIEYPSAGDTIHLSGCSVTLDISATPALFAIYSGWSGNLNGMGKILVDTTTGNITLNCANCYAGTVPLIEVTGTTPNTSFTVNGTVRGGSGMNSYGIKIMCDGIVNIVKGAGQDVLIGGGGTAAHGAYIVTTYTASVNITGDVRGSATGCGYYIAATGQGVSVIEGNIYGAASNGVGVSCNWNAHSLTINGSIYGGSASNAYGVALGACGSFTWVGGEIAGGGGTSAFGLTITAISSSLSLAGNVRGGSATTAHGISISAGQAITFTLNGTVQGGTHLRAHGIYEIVGINWLFSGNIINTTTTVAWVGRPPTYNAQNQHYVQWGTMKMPKQLTAADVRNGTTHGDFAGTLQPASAFRRNNRFY